MIYSNQKGWKNYPSESTIKGIVWKILMKWKNYIPSGTLQ